MAKIQAFLQHFQLQYRRTPPLTKAVVAAAIVLCTVTLLTLRFTYWEAQEKLGVLQEQAARLEQTNEDYAARIKALGTVDSIRQIAEEELEMVDPDTIIIEESE